MSWDLHPEEMIDKASSLPVTQTPEVGVFHNFMEGAAKVAMQGFAKTARAVDLLGAVGPIVEDWATDVRTSRALGSVPATMPKTVTAQDRYFKEHDAMFQSAVDYWTPRPNEVGLAGEVTGNLLSMLPQIMMSPSMTVGAIQLAQGQDLVREGVSPGKAQAVGAVQGLGLGAGIWMPILGTNALQRIVIGGAGFNMVQGVATRAASKAILEGDKAAEQFRPLGGTELTLDILLGLAFGTMAHINPAQRAQGAKAWQEIGNFLKDSPPSDKAALATLREAQHINLDSLPGTPQTAADLDVHVQRMRAAIDDLANDRPINVDNIVKDAPHETIEEFTARAGSEIGGVSHLQGIVEKLQRVYIEQGKDAGRALLEDMAANAPDTSGFQAEVATKGFLDELHAELSTRADTFTAGQPRYNPDLARIEQDTAIKEAIQEHARTVAAEEGIPQIPERKTIAQTIEEQLVQAGRPAEEAKAGATLWQAFFDTTASRYGRTGQELFDRYMKGITGQPGEGPSLAQANRVMENPAFRSWFDGSKAVDQQGNPIVMYHGTAADFKKFKTTADEMDETGAFFTSNPRVASEYADMHGMTPHVMPVYLAIKKPYVVTHEQWIHADGLSPVQAKASGYDGYVIKEHPGVAGSDATGDTYIAFHPEQIKSATGNRGTYDPTNPNILFQGAVPWYHSELERQISTAKMGAASPKDWKNFIKGLSNKGVKADEVKWTGLEEWLDLQQGKVTKEQIQQYMKDGGVKVEETTLGAPEGQDAYRNQLRNMDETSLRDEADNMDVDPNEYTNRESLIQAIIAAHHEDMGQAVTMEPGQAKFSQYVLPGGSNYRELLLTLPGQSPKMPDGWSVQPMEKPTDMRQSITEEWDAWLQENNISAKWNPGDVPKGDWARLSEDAQRFASDIGERWWEAVKNNEQRYTLVGPDGSGRILQSTAKSIADAEKLAIEELQRAGKIPKKQQFNSSHFDQPNILSHIRFNERTDADGKKVLFIEEIQSDWAQKGKKEGFAVPTSEAELNALRAQKQALVQKYGSVEKLSKGSDEDNAEYTRLSDKLDRLKYDAAGIPAAPFVGKTEAWVGLSLKRMIRYAAENGFDRVAWTNGEQQAARYDLSKQIKEIEYIKRGDLYELGITQNNGDGLSLPKKEYTAAELEDVVGKDVAKKIVEGEGKKYRGHEGRTLEGLDLKVGGEGMKAFYDKIVPNVANDVLKKLGGGRVSEVNITERDLDGYRLEPDMNPETGEIIDRGVSQDHKVPGFDITPAMREKAMETQALFQPAYHASPHTFDEFKLQHIGSGEGAQIYGWGLYFATNTKVRDWYYENFMAKAKNEAQTTIVDQAGVDRLLKERPDIDPKMAAEYMLWRQQGKSPAATTQFVGAAYGLDKATTKKQEQWIEQSMEIERAGLHEITAGDEPAYKTPTGEIVHTRMGGEAKAKADAIGQLMEYGYKDAARTFDQLIKGAKDVAADTQRANTARKTELENELSGELRAIPLKPGIWGNVDPNAIMFEIHGTVSGTGKNGDWALAAHTANTPEQAIEEFKSANAKAMRALDDSISKANRRVVDVERARALLDEYTEPVKPATVRKADNGSKHGWQTLNNDGTVAADFATEKGAKQYAAKIDESAQRAIKPGIEKIEPQIKKPRKYEVELAPDESEYLPWDATLASMPKELQDRLESVIGPHRFDYPDEYTGKDVYKGLVDDAREVKRGVDDDWLWAEANIDYANMTPEEMASKLLNSAGIPGIKYHDGFSRKRGEGTYNIVLFDDSKVTIKHMEQPGNRGYMNMGPDGKMAIGILKSADASTFLHESGHFFLEVTNDLASQPDAPAGMKQDMQTLYSWFGLKDADTWNNMTLDEKRPYHEQFARGFERYLRDGKAPSTGLKDLFRRFRDWLKAVYQSASQLNVEVSDQVRAVMDRMLAEPQRTEAPPEAARSAAPPPPRGGVGEPMGEASVPEGTPPKPYEPRTSDDPQILEMLRDMATNEAGWAQVGGKWMGKAEKGSGVPNFTTWIPKAEWWNDRPDKKMNEAKFVEAVTKHMTDEKMTPAEKRAVQFLTDIANKRLEAKQLYEDAEWNRIAQEVATEGMEPTTQNVVDADAVHIAMQIDEARVERAAITAADDHDFMAEVREIIDGYKPQPDATATERGTPPAAKPGTPGPAGQEANAAGADRDAGNQGVIAQQALRMVAENPDLPIATGVDAQGNTTYQKASEYLAEAKAMADLKRQDVGLFELAAQCLLGGGR